MGKTYREERAELQKAVLTHKRELLAQVSSSQRVVRKSGRKFLVGVAVISAAFLVAGWIARPRHEEPAETAPLEGETASAQAPTGQASSSSGNIFFRVIRQEITALLVGLLKENLVVLLKALPALLAKQQGQASTRSSQAESEQ